MCNSIHYKLSCRELSEEYFELRTMYNFCRRLNEHMRKTGEDLFEATLEQIAAFDIEDEQVADG